MSAVLLSAMAVLTLVTVVLSFSSVPVPLAAVLGCQLFLLVYRAFLLVCSGHFQLAVLGPGVLRDVVVSVTNLHDYMMYICM